MLKISEKNLSRELNHLLGLAKASATNTIKTTSKRVIQKITAATSDLNGGKISNKITNYSRQNDSEAEKEINRNTRRKIYISKRRQKISKEIRLV